MKRVLLLLLPACTYVTNELPPAPSDGGRPTVEAGISAVDGGITTVRAPVATSEVPTTPADSDRQTTSEPSNPPTTSGEPTTSEAPATLADAGTPVAPLSSAPAIDAAPEVDAPTTDYVERTSEPVATSEAPAKSEQADSGAVCSPLPAQRPAPADCETWTAGNCPRDPEGREIGLCVVGASPTQVDQGPWLKGCSPSRIDLPVPECVEALTCAYLAPELDGAPCCDTPTGPYLPGSWGCN